jgi:pilus assembly protein CpaB
MLAATPTGSDTEQLQIMNRRALILALVLAMAGATVLMIYMQRFEQEMSGGERVELLTLVKPIERGTTLTDEMLSSRKVPIAYVEDRAIKIAEKSKVLGLKTDVPLQSQQTLMWTDLAITTEERDLSSLVQPGKRAVTVRASGTQDMRGNALIKPGDYVDVIVTMAEQAENGIENERQKASVVLLQKVLVLAVGLDTRAAAPDPKQNPNANTNEKALTLSLSLPEAQLLALAVERGRLSVAVRNPDDQRVVEAVPDMRSNVLFDTTQRETLQRRPSAVAKRDEPVRIQGRVQ